MLRYLETSEEVANCFKQSYTNEFRNLWPLSNVVRIIKLRVVWMGHGVIKMTVKFYRLGAFLLICFMFIY